MAIVTGNTLIVKPSERDPGAAMIIAELCKQAGKRRKRAQTFLYLIFADRSSRWCPQRYPWTSTNRECHLRPPCYPGNQLRWW